MATQTTNLGLIKPAGTDYVLVSDFNTNADTLDTAIGDLDALQTTEKGSLVGAINDAVDSASATVNAGTTTTGAPGTNASVTNVGTDKDAVFNFTIPRGDPGVSVTVGTTTTGAAGSSASVSNSGTASDPILDFTVPQGANGVGVPTGGAIGQALVKSGAPDFGTEWAAVGRTNPNLLHNWDFRFNPVNQRGASGDITTSVYFYDRWSRQGGTITIAAGYLNLPANAGIEQKIEGNALAGKTVTVSVMVGNTVYSGTGTFPTSSGAVTVTIPNFGEVLLDYGTGRMLVWFIARTSTRQLQAVKLEMGTISTLANDAPAEYSIELARSQRYFQPLELAGGSGFHDGGGAFFTITFFLPVPMRITPSIASSGGLTSFVYNNNFVIGVALTSVISYNNGKIALRFNGDTPSGYYLVTSGPPNTTAWLSADL